MGKGKRTRAKRKEKDPVAYLKQGIDALKKPRTKHLQKVTSIEKRIEAKEAELKELST